MRTYTVDEYNLKKSELLKEIKDGAVFIYPTDTIYGIGCNALNAKSVNKIRQLKKRINQPFSVIAPDKEWITKNCEIIGDAVDYLEKLPGPYTFITFLKGKNAVVKKTNDNRGTLGVRIPDHWSKELAQISGVPIISTSVNLTGEVFMTSPDELGSDFRKGVDFLIDEGKVEGRPSKIIDFTVDVPVETER